MSGRHAADTAEPDQPQPEEPQLPAAADPEPADRAEPGIPAPAPEPYVEPAEEHQSSGEGPAQWVETDEG